MLAGLVLKSLFTVTQNGMKPLSYIINIVRLEGYNHFLKHPYICDYIVPPNLLKAEIFTFVIFILLGLTAT